MQPAMDKKNTFKSLKWMKKRMRRKNYMERKRNIKTNYDWMMEKKLCLKWKKIENEPKHKTKEIERKKWTIERKKAKK